MLPCSDHQGSDQHMRYDSPVSGLRYIQEKGCPDSSTMRTSPSSPTPLMRRPYSSSRSLVLRVQTVIAIEPFEDLRGAVDRLRVPATRRTRRVLPSSATRCSRAWRIAVSIHRISARRFGRSPSRERVQDANRTVASYLRAFRRGAFSPLHHFGHAFLAGVWAEC